MILKAMTHLFYYVCMMMIIILFSYLLQRLAIAVQHDNAISVLGMHLFLY